MEEVTRESLRPLLELQRIDSALDRLEQRRQNLPEQRALEELTEARKEIAARDADQRLELESSGREQAKLEGEIELIREKIERERGRLYGGEISHPKELASIQAELDALQRRKNHLEDQELEVMERRETTEAEAAAVSKELAGIDAQIAEATARRDSAATEIGGEVVRLRAEREELVRGLHPEVLERYETMRPKHGGIAVGGLERGICTACNLPLSPLARDEIRRSDDPFVRCENCRRLLVMV